jgi:hypothetical protein
MKKNSIQSSTYACSLVYSHDVQDATMTMMLIFCEHAIFLLFGATSSAALHTRALVCVALT